LLGNGRDTDEEVEARRNSQHGTELPGRIAIRRKAEDGFGERPDLCIEDASMHALTASPSKITLGYLL
jgi:hypothetical protein